MKKTRILYNDSCPICSREIKHYKRLVDEGDLPLAFDKLSADTDAWGLTPDRAAKRLHVRQGGELLSGFDAFVALWSAIPRYRWLARVCHLPGIRTVVACVYNFIAAPLLYRLHQQRQRKRAS